MKNQKRVRIVAVLGKTFNVRRWCDYDRVKGFTRFLFDGFKKFFIPQKGVIAEPFAVIQKRLNLSEDDLLSRQKGLLRLSIIMGVLAALILVYSVYLFIIGGIMGGILGLVVMFIALALAFRYNFWYFQIKQRKLGCTINDWINYSLKGDK